MLAAPSDSHKSLSEFTSFIPLAVSGRGARAARCAGQVSGTSRSFGWVLLGRGDGPAAPPYGIFLAVVATLLVGGKLLADALDKPVGKSIPKSAPWAQPHAKQHPTKPL